MLRFDKKAEFFDVFHSTGINLVDHILQHVCTHFKTSEIVLGVLHHGHTHNSVTWRSLSVARACGGVPSYTRSSKSPQTLLWSHLTHPRLFHMFRDRIFVDLFSPDVCHVVARVGNLFSPEQSSLKHHIAQVHMPHRQTMIPMAAFASTCSSIAPRMTPCSFVRTLHSHGLLRRRATRGQFCFS